MKFTQYYGKRAKVTADSHIEEQEDGTFKLIWTRLSSKEITPVQGRVKLDVVRPGRR